MSPVICPPGQASESLVFRALDQLWEVTLEDIELDWIYAMTKRLLKELNRQLAHVEAQKYDNKADQPPSPERLLNARTLASLRGTLKELAQMKTGRETAMDGRKTRTPDAARNEIKRRIHKRPA
jgi:hypothetical protein